MGVNDIELVNLAVSRGYLLRRREVETSSVSPWRWARLQDLGLWVQVTPDHFRHLATPPSLELEIVAGAEWLGRRGALFGTTALWWFGVEVPPPSHAEFLVPRADRAIPNWMTIHTSRTWHANDIVRHRGVRSTTAARALVDLASTMPSARTLEEAIDSAVRLRRTSLHRLRAELAAVSAPGRRGIVLLRELLLDSGGESRLERRFLRLTRIYGLPRPDCQVVMRAGGRHIARVDFRFDGVVVEVSGRLGHVSDRERQKDARRRNELQSMGFTVLEFTTADVMDDPEYILATLARHGVRPARRVSSPPTAPGRRARG